MKPENRWKSPYISQNKFFAIHDRVFPIQTFKIKEIQDILSTLLYIRIPLSSLNNIITTIRLSGLVSHFVFLLQRAFYNFLEIFIR